jgi:hypothetical protein
MHSSKWHRQGDRIFFMLVQTGTAGRTSSSTLLLKKWFTEEGKLFRAVR